MGTPVQVWRCPTCGDVSEHRMQWEPPATGPCPICMQEFEHLRIHMAGTECLKWWNEGMLWLNRPEWARAAR